MITHVFAGFAAMTAQALAPIAYGLGLRQVSAQSQRAVSLALGFISTAGLFALVSGMTSPGLAQKTMQIAADAWVFLTAMYLHNRHGQTGATTAASDS
jgi:hypothetical protein